jgi:protein ImuB
MLWLALHFPQLPLDLLGPVDGVPVAVAEPRSSRPCVILANAEAQREGVVPGLTVAGARGLCARLRVRQRDAAGERAALERLAAWACQFSPRLALEPDALLIEVGRSRRLFGGLGPLLARVREGLAGLGVRAVPFLAPTPEGALQLARAGEEGSALDLASLKERLAFLPLHRLPLGERERAVLRGAGLRTLGEVLALPRAGLARRFGTGLGDWLDRLLGMAPDPRPDFTLPASYHGRLELAAEVERVEPLLFPARRLLGELGGFLLGRQLGTQRLDWLLHHADLPPTRFGLGLARLERDPGRFQALLRERLERVVLPAPVRALELLVDSLASLADRPTDLFEGRVREQGEALLERLEARLGPDAVKGLRLCADHRPERAFGLCAPGETGLGPALPERPFWLLAEPRALRVRDGRPWRGGPLALTGERERIETGWWDGGGVAREYFTARTACGERLWVYRDLVSGNWYLQGLFG